MKVSIFVIPSPTFALPLKTGLLVITLHKKIDQESFANYCLFLKIFSSL